MLRRAGDSKVQPSSWPQEPAWLGHSCACPGEHSREHKAGDSSGEEVRSLCVPGHGEGAVLAVNFLQATSWLKVHKQYALASHNSWGIKFLPPYKQLLSAQSNRGIQRVFIFRHVP